jgi:hypothetical protein
MATSPSRPGVTVNQSLTPLSTSAAGSAAGAIAVFAAPYNIGPVQPTLVTSWQRYVALYGGFNVANGSVLSYAVWQFFNNGGQACYVIRVPNSNAVLATATIDSVQSTVVNPTTAPTVVTAATGGTVAAGTYTVEISYVSASGETLPSPATSVTTTGSTSTLTIDSPPTATGATGWYAYVSQVGGTTLTRQQTAGSSTAIGTNLTITAPPTSTGTNPLTANSTGTSSPVLTLTTLAPGAYGNSLYYEVVPASPLATSDNTATFSLNIYQGGTAPGNIVESWPGVSMNPSSGRYLLSLLNATQGGSSYVSGAAAYTGNYTAGGSNDPVGNAGEPLALSGGNDGTTAPSDANLATAIAGIPNGNVTSYSGTGWACSPLTTVPQSNVFNLNMPGADIGLINTMIGWAAGQGNVFVIVDGSFVGPSSSSTSIANSYASLVTGGAGAALTPSPNATARRRRAVAVHPRPGQLQPDRHQVGRAGGRGPRLLGAERRAVQRRADPCGRAGNRRRDRARSVLLAVRPEHPPGRAGQPGQADPQHGLRHLRRPDAGHRVPQPEHQRRPDAGAVPGGLPDDHAVRGLPEQRPDPVDLDHQHADQLPDPGDAGRHAREHHRVRRVPGHLRRHDQHAGDCPGRHRQRAGRRRPGLACRVHHHQLVPDVERVHRDGL